MINCLMHHMGLAAKKYVWWLDATKKFNKNLVSLMLTVWHFQILMPESLYIFSHATGWFLYWPSLQTSYESYPDKHTYSRISWGADSPSQGLYHYRTRNKYSYELWGSHSVQYKDYVRSDALTVLNIKITVF